MDRVTDKYVFFWGDETFSNWGNAEFEYLDKIFYNSEQAFMSRKAAYFDDWDTFEEILKIGSNPSVAKKLGRKVKNFNSERWMEVCLDEMIDVVHAKFSQNPKLLKTLLSTGDKIIVEASPYDTVWGIGLHWEDDRVLDESQWRGENLLGKALMEVRSRLR